MKGWHNEPMRHSLAARGHKTVPPRYRKPGYEVYKNGVYQGFTSDLDEAKDFADEHGGQVVDAKNRRKILYRARAMVIPVNRNYEYATGQSAIEIAQGYVDQLGQFFYGLTDPDAYRWARDRRKFRGYLDMMYDYHFSDDEVTELMGVVIDMFGETKWEMGQ